MKKFFYKGVPKQSFTRDNIFFYKACVFIVILAFYDG